MNYLIDRLSAADRDHLMSFLEPVRLPKGMVLSRPNESPSLVYFLSSGIASVVVVSPEGHQAETGVVGREGFTPLSAVLKTGSLPFEIFMQVDGDGLAISPERLSAVLVARPTILAHLLRYSQAFFVQSAFTSLSNAKHTVEERLARWLLMCHDRVDGDRMSLTHEFIALMLSVRRPSVTTALHVLEGNRFITSSRGLVTVRDRTALEEFASDSYGLSEREYERLLGPLTKGARP
ncbi:Crp/Fnr family transcriptional regulator [Rhizobium sp. NPDC090275]|uniref:Crp/Fnr family transcriptional regulator n=1 Tax=Rhizobium sp. NPDC090275 TaxID=3364498 RepID=UPI000DDDBA97